jgi:hypothetical protein
MSGGWLGRTAILLLMGLVTVAPASADGPGRKFKHLTDETFTSPDGQLRVEQYSRASNDDTIHQFWSFDRNRQRGSLLNRNEDPDLAGHPAGFRFSPDGWRCIYDLKAGKFSVPPEFADNNAKAVKTRDPRPQ